MGVGCFHATVLDLLVAEACATPTLGELVAQPNKWTGRTAVITFDDG